MKVCPHHWLNSENMETHVTIVTCFLIFKGSDLSEATAEGEDKEERKGGTEMFIVALI